MSQPVPLTSESAEQIGRAWLFHAAKIDLYVAHSRDELQMIDGFPAGGDGGNGDNTPTEAAAMARYNVTSTRDQISDDLATIVELSNSLFKVLDRGLRSRVPDEAQTILTCTCGNMASRHTLADGTTITDRCDDCWPTRCQVCGTRDAEGRKVDSRPACGACYRRMLRSTVKEVA